MVLITGASAGIGAACAQAFARKKHDLLLLARRRDRLENLASKLRKECGVNVTIAVCDISDAAQIDAFAKSHDSELARCKVLVNNAGLATGLEKIQEGDPDQWDIMWDTNVRALLRLTRRVLPHFLKNGEGHIVNIGSIAGRWVYPKGNIYCATKRAVSAITEALRLDLNGTGIRVTEISPGMVETEFSLVRLKDPEKAKAVYAGVSALTPDDIAEAVVWSSDRPKHVNIQEMVIYPTDQASPAVLTRR